MLTTILLAGLVAVQGDTRVTVTDAPCETIPQWKKATYFDGTTLHEGCWRLARQDLVLLVYGDGDIGFMPVSAFKTEQRM